MSEKEIRRILATARFKFRSDTLVNWQTNNPVLLEGEAGVVTGLNEVGDGLENKSQKIKFGDGIHDWNNLDWWYGPEGQGGGSNVIVDQTYNPESENAQSGRAVAEAVDRLIETNLTNISGENISSSKWGGLTENLITRWVDGKYAITRDSSTPYPTLSYGTADITDYETLILTTWIEPTRTNSLVFYSDSNIQITTKVSAEDCEEIETGVYKVKKPSGATGVHINIYTENKANSYVKGFDESGTKPLDWLELQEGNFPNNCIPISAIQKESKYKYGDSLLKPFDFNGKSVVAFGDSITFGIASPNLQNLNNGNCYIKLFANKVGATLSNQAVSGSCITDTDTTTNSIYDKVTSYTGNADFIIISGGINDYLTGKSLGTYSSTDTTNFYGALRGICEYLQTNHADKTIIFITPVNVTRTWSDAVEELNAYRNAIFEIATLYKFNVVDGSSLGLPTEKGDWSNAMIDDTDCCHPTELGHYQYFKGLCNKLL